MQNSLFDLWLYRYSFYIFFWKYNINIFGVISPYTGGFMYHISIAKKSKTFLHEFLLWNLRKTFFLSFFDTECLWRSLVRNCHRNFSRKLFSPHREVILLRRKVKLPRSGLSKIIRSNPGAHHLTMHSMWRFSTEGFTLNKIMKHINSYYYYIEIQWCN